MASQNTRFDLPQRSSYGGKSTPVNKFKKGGMVTTGKAADREMADLVKKTKSGKGTLTFAPKKKGKK